MAPPLGTVPLIAVLGKCLETIKKTFTDVDIEVKWSAQDPMVVADEYLDHMLLNLLENAIYHNEREDRRLWVIIKEIEEGYEVSIADNGPGVSDEKKQTDLPRRHRTGIPSSPGLRRRTGGDKMRPVLQRSPGIAAC